MRYHAFVLSTFEDLKDHRASVIPSGSRVSLVLPVILWGHSSSSWVYDPFEELLLLNIARAYFHEPPHFTQTSSIQANFSFKSTSPKSSLLCPLELVQGDQL